jgi:nucleoside 2-deoxyribosyltransferase
MSYRITGTAAATLQHWSMRDRSLLAGRVRRHWAQARSPAVVTSETLEAGVDDRLTVTEKLDALLIDTAARSAFPGAVVTIDDLDHVVVNGSVAEFRFHLQALLDRQLLRGSAASVFLTSQGWERVETLLKPAGGNRADIFVAMSFSESLISAWEIGIKPGVRGAGYNPKRVDSDAHNDKIDDRIIAGIRASYATVVDVTSQNAGAYFEAGFALGLGRPVVWTVRKDDLPNLHFDTRQFNHLVWTTPDELREKLTNHLLAVFGRGPSIGLD